MNFRALGANLGLEEDEYRELIELFIETGRSDFKNMQEALAAGDFDQLLRSAHTIKGASGNLGLTGVSAAARHIEELAMKRRLEEAQDALHALKEQFETIQASV